MAGRRRPGRRSPRPPRPLSPRAIARSQPSELLAGDLTVVERDLATVFELLPLLVPLAGDDDGVPLRGLVQRQPDREAPVGLDLDPGGAAIEPGDDLLD